ncbi:wax ester/triacylglycerol synthase family O-acyltransferase, partial [Streptomyces flavotricini]
MTSTSATARERQYVATEHLSPLDLAFWRIESAAHPMHLGALAVFEAAPAPQDAPGAGPGPGAGPEP